MKLKQFNKAAVFTAVISALSISSSYAEEASNDIERQTIETITVLGEKANRSLKDTTSSVSVITEEDLNGGQFLSFLDVISDTPNLVAVQGDAPNIRGVTGNGSASGFNSFFGGAKPRVSTIIDGVVEPFVAELNGDSGIWDIEQIEVFRGPQSTTNGRNSIGGLVFVKTKDPSFDWEGAARLGYRNQENLIETSGVISGPLLDDELAFRLSAQQLKGDVYGNYAVKRENQPDYPFDPNELTSRRVKAKLLWQPQQFSGFSALLSLSRNEEVGNNNRSVFDGPDIYAQNKETTRYIDTSSDVVSLKMNYQITDSLSVDTTIADMQYVWDMIQHPFTWFVKMEEDSLTTDTKLNYTPDNGFFSGFLGVYYFTREQTFSNRGLYDGTDDSSSRALYGEGSFDINDKLNIVVGGRYENERQIRPFRMPARGFDIELDTDKNIFLPKFAALYDLGNTTLGFSARKGYNAGGGGYNWGTAEYYYYEQEKVSTYELSSRSEFMDGDIQVSANVFFNDYDGYQDGGFGDTGLPEDYRIINVKQAETYGAELAVSGLLTDDLEFNLGMGVLKTEVTKTDEFNPQLLNNELSNAPSFTTNLGLKYWLLEQGYINVSMNYVGEYFTDIRNTAKSGDYVLTRLALGYETDNWLFNAYVNNLFDAEKHTRVNLSRADNSTILNGTILMPRTLGASVTYRF